MVVNELTYLYLCTEVLNLNINTQISIGSNLLIYLIIILYCCFMTFIPCQETGGRVNHAKMQACMGTAEQIHPQYQQKAADSRHIPPPTQPGDSGTTQA